MLNRILLSYPFLIFGKLLTNVLVSLMTKNLLIKTLEFALLSKYLFFFLKVLVL